MKKLLLTLSLLTISLLTSAQWVAQMHSPISAQSIAMKTDGAENVYIAGIYNEVLTIFGVGRTGDANTTLTGTSTTLTGISV
jgi:hypothetical protein